MERNKISYEKLDEAAKEAGFFLFRQKDKWGNNVLRFDFVGTWWAEKMNFYIEFLDEEPHIAFFDRRNLVYEISLSSKTYTDKIAEHMAKQLALDSEEPIDNLVEALLYYDQYILAEMNLKLAILDRKNENK